ncbi:hypothetical protein [[Mycoplasma] mobile]|uniref:Expressed protein n=1 Tax=Mycoplasma mobile (strain ATCC 43663 / 163K / NCTC 11711) TaxID=267748 RepID=Q6KIS1_MYCM1|nr:hypothetical protein [[Mycoplasma] mobile]AAT27504.1 expressed protein [Mycoplasma mobile 163K]
MKKKILEIIRKSEIQKLEEIFNDGNFYKYIIEGVFIKKEATKSNQNILNAIENLSKSFDTKIENLSKSFDTKIENLSKSINTRLDKIENRLENVEKDIALIKSLPTIQKELKVKIL